jgi:hypothetical protein
MAAAVAEAGYTTHNYRLEGGTRIFAKTSAVRSSFDGCILEISHLILDPRSGWNVSYVLMKWRKVYLIAGAMA